MIAMPSGGKEEKMNKAKSHLGKQLLVIATLAMLMSSALWMSACQAVAPVPTPTPTPVPAPPGSPVPPSPPGAVTRNLTAANMAFDKSNIVVTVGQNVTVVFENKDSVPHNFAAYEDKTAAKEIYVGETITGPKTITYQFTAPEKPGAYFFRCDVHPTTMTGSFVVQATTS